jgi:hypothetical protein
MMAASPRDSDVCHGTTIVSLVFVHGTVKYGATVLMFIGNPSRCKESESCIISAGGTIVRSLLLQPGHLRRRRRSHW